MARNIVLCLDGTGNQFDQHNTNVVKLFRVLERQPGRQLAYYDPGVGTLPNPASRTPLSKRISKGMGQAFGAGLIQNVEQTYAYLMDHYQVGDRLFLFGFSRGAYTARVLAGFIHHCGLLEPGCQNLIPYAMKLYTTSNRRPMDDEDWRLAATFRKTYGRRAEGGGETAADIPIDFLGLWDSVSTFGWVWDPVFLPHTSRNPSVHVVRHALAIDERRAFFRPLHWGPEPPPEQDVKEVWFPGVHSDVGGGYPEAESGLAKIALEWMIEQALSSGLRVDSAAHRRYVLGEDSPDYVAPSSLAPAHRSLTGAWRGVEYLPRRVWDPDRRRKVFRRPTPNQPRNIPMEPMPRIHRSVIERMEAGGYAPPNLPGLETLRERVTIED